MTIPVQDLIKRQPIPQLEAEPRHATAVKWWAAVGFADCILAVYVFIRWISSGNVHRTPPGPTSPPDWLPAVIHLVQFIGPVAALSVIYWFVVRQGRREGHLTVDGILVIAWLLTAFPSDAFLNYSQFHYSYNALYFNLGSWTGEIPGVLMPRAHLFPEPLVWVSGYTWACFLPSVLGCWVLRQIKMRNPRIGKIGLLGSLFAFFFVFDLISEVLAMRAIQGWAYPGAIRGLSLWPGTVYQFPLYEAVFMGLFFTAASGLRYFRDDRGRLLFERGIERVRTSSRGKTGLRLLAALGATVAITSLTYGLPMQWFGTHADEFPKGMPSYFIAGLCGEGTPNPCPGPHTPIYRPGSVPQK